jgi:HAD superfamily hydrolase (TIGR01490 family)
MGPKLHLFDVDHTITRGSTGRRFAEAAALRGVIKLRHLAIVPFNYAAYRLGRGGASFFEGEFPVIRGVERSLLEAIARDVFERRTRKAIRPSLLAIIAAIRAEGGSVVLATSSLDFIVRPLAELLGAEAVIASALEYEGGRCTGRLDGAALFGEAKREAVRDYARGRGAELADCSFYSDSIHDLPLLLAVGEPVAVCPDRRLRAEASSRGWRILEAY